MSSQALKLIRPMSGLPRDPYTIDRRVAPRHNVTGRVTAVCTEVTLDGARNRICSLQMLNISDSGLGAVSQDAIAPDTAIGVYFPPHGNEKGFDLIGRVVRCRRRSNGHELGVSFDRLAAA